MVTERPMPNAISGLYPNLPKTGVGSGYASQFERVDSGFNWAAIWKSVSRWLFQTPEAELLGCISSTLADADTLQLHKTQPAKPLIVWESTLRLTRSFGAIASTQGMRHLFCDISETQLNASRWSAQFLSMVLPQFWLVIRCMWCFQTRMLTLISELNVLNTD